MPKNMTLSRCTYRDTHSSYGFSRGSRTFYIARVLGDEIAAARQRVSLQRGPMNYRSSLIRGRALTCILQFYKFPR